MAQRELLRNKRIGFLLLLPCFLLAGCTENEAGKIEQPSFKAVDISKIPDRIISGTHPELKMKNGIYYFDNKPFSGFIKGEYGNGTLKFFGSYFQGMQHGITQTFYSDGTLRDERSYKANIGYGRHFGFWENGKMKFDFFYLNDKWEGIQKQWYPSGQLYLCLSFKNDYETGMQKAWRENGKLFANYEVKDGIRYGLQKTNLCYTLRNQKLN